MTRGQSRALAELGPHLVIENPVWSQQFPRSAPLGIEIGFGMGHALLDWAGQHPDWNFVGIEVYRPGIGALLQGVERLALTNVRVVAEDARSAIDRCFQAASINEVRIFFPDPWPKTRHHKRRLIRSDFVSMVADRMCIGAKLLLATDWHDYAESMLVVLDREPMLTNVAGAGCFSEQAAIRSATRFEDKGRKLGHAVWDLAYVRNRCSTESRCR